MENNTDTTHLEDLINWLIFKRYGKTQAQIARKLGYTRSSLSQIVNGRVPLSRKFAERVCTLDKSLNEEWVFTGKGNMFKEKKYKSGKISGNSDLNEPPEEYEISVKKEEVAVKLLVKHIKYLETQNQELSKKVGRLENELKKSQKKRM